MVYEFENDNIMLDSKKKVTAISRKMNVTVRKKIEARILSSVEISSFLLVVFSFDL